MIVFQENINLSDSEKDYIIENLPMQWETVIKDVRLLDDMEVFLKINAKTIEEANIWINQFQEQTNTTYSVFNTRKCAGERLTYKKFYKCHHNTRRKETYDPVCRKRVKNTKCPSFLMVHMRVTGKRYRGKNQNDKPDPERPCEIKVKLQHNHSLTDGMASKFRRVLPEIKNELINLFKQGHTPATALQRLKSDIRVSYENHEEILSDRSKCPDYRFCHYIYDRYIVKAQDQININEDFLENKLENYNHIMQDDCAKMAVDDTGYVLCFCPPLVKRIHKYGTSSSSVTFIYTMNISDKSESKIYILLTYCEMGALPLGVIVSTSKSITLLHTAFSLLKDMLGETAFGGNTTGPEYFIVEESLANKNILNSLWPRSTVLLSVSFVLKNVWEWLKNASIKYNKQPEENFVLFTDFYNLVHSSNELDFITKYEIAKTNANIYDQYLKLISNYYESRKQWALFYRSNLFLRGNSANEKYSENVFRIMKTSDLLQLQSINLHQSVDFIMNNFFLYFEHRLIDAANTGIVQSILEMKEDMPSIDTLQKIKILGSNMHLVPAEKSNELMYIIDTDLLTCTCFKGHSGTLCKHIHWMCLLVCSDLYNKKKLNISEISSNYYQILQKDQPEEDQTATIVFNDDSSIDNEPSINFIDNNNEIISHVETQPDINLFNIKNDIFFEDGLIVEVTENLIEEQNETITEKSIKEGKEVWKKMTEIYEHFLHNSPEQVTAAASNMLTNLEKIQTISDFCRAITKCGDEQKTNQNISPTNKEVAAATKLLLLSSGNVHPVSEQTVIVNPPNDDTAKQPIPLQNASTTANNYPSTNESGMKRIILLSGNISCVQGSDHKKIKLIPIQNSTNANNTTIKLV